MQMMSDKCWRFIQYHGFHSIDLRLLETYKTTESRKEKNSKKFGRVQVKKKKATKKQNKEIGFHNNWSREMLYTDFAHVKFRLQGKKKFVASGVTGDGKWIHFDNPKEKKFWRPPGHGSILTDEPNVHEKKTNNFVNMSNFVLKLG